MAEIRIPATLENLETVLGFVNEQMELAECPERLMTHVDLAVEEIFVNIASYAYHPEVGEAVVCCEAGGDPFCITIGFIDQGKPYNPLEREAPDISLEAEEREIGGLGIFMVKKLMDDIHYEFRDVKNILTLKKNIR